MKGCFSWGGKNLYCLQKCDIFNESVKMSILEMGGITIKLLNRRAVFSSVVVNVAKIVL